MEPFLLQDAFYSKEAVEQAVRDYGKIARISVRENGHSILCAVEECPAGTAAELVRGEFVNYVLGLTVRQRGLMEQ